MAHLKDTCKCCDVRMALLGVALNTQLATFVISCVGSAVCVCVCVHHYRP